VSSSVEHFMLITLCIHVLNTFFVHKRSPFALSSSEDTHGRVEKLSLHSFSSSTGLCSQKGPAHDERTGPASPVRL